MILDAIRRFLGRGDAPEPPKLSCEEALERVYEFMDGELDPTEAGHVEEHFRICTCCYPHLRLEECFRARVRAALGESEVPESVRIRVRELLDREEEVGGV